MTRLRVQLVNQPNGTFRPTWPRLTPDYPGATASLQVTVGVNGAAARDVRVGPTGAATATMAAGSTAIVTVNVLLHASRGRTFPILTVVQSVLVDAAGAGLTFPPVAAIWPSNSHRHPRVSVRPGDIGLRVLLVDVSFIPFPWLPELLPTHVIADRYDQTLAHAPGSVDVVLLEATGGPPHFYVVALPDMDPSMRKTHEMGAVVFLPPNSHGRTGHAMT